MKVSNKAAERVFDTDFKTLREAVGTRPEKVIQACLWSTLLVFAYAYMRAFYTMYKFFDFTYHDAGLVLHGIMTMFHGGHDMPFFNTHFSPVFFLLGPLIKLASPFIPPILSFAALHVTASVAIIWLAYGITRHLTGNGFLGLLSGLLVACNPFFASTSAVMHFEIMGFVGLLAFFYFALRAKHGLALCFLLVALASKEDVWSHAFFMWFILMGKLERRPYLMYLGVIVAYYLIGIKFLHGTFYPQRYDKLTESFGISGGVAQVLMHLLSNLPTTLPKMFNVNALWLVFTFGVGFLLAAPIRALSFWGLLFLCTNTAHTKMSHLYYYYSWQLLMLGIVLIPFAVLNIKQRLRPPQWHMTAVAMCYLIAFGSITAAHWTRLEGIHPIFTRWYRLNSTLPSSHRTMLKVIKEHLPTMQGSVMADSNLTPYVTDRRTMVLNSDRDMGFQAYKDGKALYNHVLYLLDIITPYLGKEERQQQAAYIRQDARYEIVVDHDSVFYARLKDPAQAVDATL